MIVNRLVSRVLGLLFVAVGLVLVSNPELVSNAPVPEDTFEAVERRIWWGLIVGFGLLLLFHAEVQPWQRTLVATGTALVLGLLVARLVGIALDGSVAKQWVYVGIELAILLPLLWLYLRKRRSTPTDS